MRYLATAFCFGAGLAIANGLNVVTAERFWFACCALLTHWLSERFIWVGKS